MHSAPVIRMADAKPVQLGHVGGADGRWRILLFTGARDTMGSLHALCSFLTAPGSGPCLRFTLRRRSDIDSVIDVRAILQDRHQHVRFEALPDLLRPRKGRFSLVDYEKVFCPDFGAGDIFDTRDIDRQSGCAVVVRPDQYVSHILPLDAHAALSAFFSAFMLDQLQFKRTTVHYRRRGLETLPCGHVPVELASCRGYCICIASRTPLIHCLRAKMKFGGADFTRVQT